MENVSFSISESPRGPVTTLRIGERAVSVHASPGVTSNKFVGPHIKNLNDGVAMIAEAIAAKAPDLTPTGVAKAGRELAAAMLANPFKATQTGYPMAEADLTGRWTTATNFKFPDDQPPIVRVEQRQYVRSLALPQKIEVLRSNSNPGMLAAFIEGGHNMSGMALDMFENFKRQLTVDNVASQFANHPDFRTKPGVADPIGGKVDLKAVRAHAEKWVAALDAERATLNEVPALLSSVTDLVSLITDDTRGAAFGLLSGTAA